MSASKRLSHKNLASILEINKTSDGGYVKKTGDGTNITIRADGTRIETTSTGLTLETRPDGTKVQTTAEGKRVEVTPNGKIRTSFIKDMTNNSENVPQNQNHNHNTPIKTNTNNNVSKEMVQASPALSTPTTTTSNLSPLKTPVGGISPIPPTNEVNQIMTLDRKKLNQLWLQDIKQKSKNLTAIPESDQEGNTSIVKEEEEQEQHKEKEEEEEEEDGNKEQSDAISNDDTTITKKNNNIDSEENAKIAAETKELEEQSEHYYNQFVIAMRLLQKEKKLREKDAKETNLKIHKLDKQKLAAEELVKKAERESASAKAHIEAKYRAQVNSLQARIRTLQVLQSSHLAPEPAQSTSSLNSSFSLRRSFSFSRRKSVSTSLNSSMNMSALAAAQKGHNRQETAYLNRIQELEEALAEQTTAAEVAKEKASAYLEAAVQSEAMVADAQNEAVELRFVKSKLEVKCQSLRAAKEKLEAQIEDLIFKGGSIAEQLQNLQDEMAELQETNAKLTDELANANTLLNGQSATQSQEIFALQREIRQLKESNRTSILNSNNSNSLTSRVTELQEAVKKLQQEKEEVQNQLEGSRKRALEAENQVKKLRNQETLPEPSKAVPSAIVLGMIPTPPPLPAQMLTKPMVKRSLARTSIVPKPSNRRKSTITPSAIAPSEEMTEPVKTTANTMNELMMLKAKQRESRVMKLEGLISSTGAQPGAAPAPHGSRKNSIIGRQINMSQMFNNAMASRRMLISADDDLDLEDDENESDTSDSEW